MKGQLQPLNTHLNISVGQQQIQDYIRSEQIHAVQAFLDAAQLLTQGFATEALPRQPDLLPDRLPEVLAVTETTIPAFRNLK